MKSFFRLRVVLIILFVVTLVAVLSSCVGQHAVTDGRLRDTIFGIEVKKNGSYFIWMVHDDVGVYCTMDAAIFAEAQRIFNDQSKAPEVIISYISLNVGSPENPVFNLAGTEGCRHERATVYVIKHITQVGPG